MSVIDDYLQKVDPANRAELERVRQIIRSVAPEAEEVITYGMPGFKYRKKYLIAFAAFKDHLSIFPGAGAVEAFKDQLDGFELSKGTVQFTLEHPLPEALLRQLVEHRLNDIVNK